jgi:large subunit ribosomal protein L25
MEKITLPLNKRKGSGKGEARKLRRDGSIPGVVYGKSAKPVPVSLDENEWRAALHNGLQLGRLVELSWVKSKKRKAIALLRAVQLHPVTDRPLHLDFQLVVVGEEIDVDVPLELNGTPVGVKDEGGKLEQLIRRVKVRCLPGKIPDKIVVDIDHLSVGVTLHVSDLTWDEGEILTDPSTGIVSVAHPRAEEPEPTEEEVEEAAEGVEEGEAETTEESTREEA